MHCSPPHVADVFALERAARRAVHDAGVVPEDDVRVVRPLRMNLVSIIPMDLGKECEETTYFNRCGVFWLAGVLV